VIWQEDSPHRIGECPDRDLIQTGQEEDALTTMRDARRIHRLT